MSELDELKKKVDLLRRAVEEILAAAISEDRDNEYLREADRLLEEGFSND